MAHGGMAVGYRFAVPEATRITGLPSASIGLVLRAHPSSSVMQATSANTLVLIPARMAATRLPGKPLIDIHGEPMIVHVLRRAQEAAIGEVVVATDSEAVATAVEKAGGRAVMTSVDHPSGSDRIHEALLDLDPERRIGMVVNVQGDLPTIDPAAIKAALGPLKDKDVDIATLAAVIKTDAEANQPERRESHRGRDCARSPACPHLYASQRDRRRAALSPHRALRVPARNAGEVRQAAAIRK